MFRYGAMRLAFVRFGCGFVGDALFKACESLAEFQAFLAHKLGEVGGFGNQPRELFLGGLPLLLRRLCFV